MAEDLQQLIDRIQRDAVDVGKEEAEKLVADAKKRADTIEKEAEEKARAILEKADQDSLQYAHRSNQAIEQASRDLLISVGAGVEKIFKELAGNALGEVLSADVVKEMITRMTEAYAKNASEGQSIEIHLSPKDQQALVEFFSGKFSEKLAGGVQLTADQKISGGFTVELKEQKIRHDLTREAIAEALSRFLRPKLSEVVYKVAREQSTSSEGSAA